MRYEDLVQQLKQRVGRFAVSNALIRDRKGRKWEAFGSLSFQNEDFLLELMTTELADLTIRSSDRVIHQRDFWDISGHLEGKWRFRCRKVPPSSLRHGFGEKTTWVFSTTSLDILHGLDDRLVGMSLLRLEGFIPRFKVPITTEFTITKTENSLEKTESHSGPVLHDRLDEYEYGLITSDAGLRFVFWSKFDYSRLSPLIVKRQIDSIMASLSFLSGIDAQLAWFAVEYRGRRWFERFRSAEQYQPNIYSPFEHQMLVFQRDSCLEALRKVQTLVANTIQGAEAATIQGLLRQVTGRSLRLRVLVAAVLFERMVDLANDSIPVQRQDAGAAKPESAFSIARRGILDFIDLRIKEVSVSKDTAQKSGVKLSSTDVSDDAMTTEALIAYRRLRGALGLKEKQTREKWLELSTHYGLKGCDDIFDAWKNARPTRAHGGIIDDYSAASIENDLEQLSLIASGINVLLLKMAGYTGPCTKWKIAPQKITI